MTENGMEPAPPLLDDNPFNKPDSCRMCSLFREPGIVRGSGNRNAKILYLGEAPGAEEVDWPAWYDRTRHGEPHANMRVEIRRRPDGTSISSSVGFRPSKMAPFVGGSGRIRATLLSHAGISPQAHLWTTNCVKCRPPENRLPTTYEVACCAGFLLEELDDVNPNVIIAAGELALETLTGKKKIGLWRGVPTMGPHRRRDPGHREAAAAAGSIARESGQADGMAAAFTDDATSEEDSRRGIRFDVAPPAEVVSGGKRSEVTGSSEERSPEHSADAGADPQGVAANSPGPSPAEGAAFKVFPTWHPAFIMRQQYQWPFAVHDYARALVESSFPEIRRVPFVIERRANLADTAGDMLAAARARGACTFDFETTGLSSYRDSIRMVGLVGRPEQARVYDWTIGAQQLFEELFADDRIEICGQNILYFDLPFAEDKGHRIRWERIFDTMVAFHLANSSYGQTSVHAQNAGSYAGARGTEKDLSFIASNHTDIEYWKSRDAYASDIYGVCGVDVIATDRSAYHPVHGLKAELRSYDMLDLYYKHVLPVHKPLRRMTQRGMKIDQDRAARWSVVLERESKRMEAILKEGLGDPFLNLDSPKQLMALLYDKLCLPVQYLVDKKRGRRPTANAEALEALALLAPENKILMSIVDIRHLNKMKSTYVDDGLMWGRLHPRFGVSKAANGRFNGWGPNAQNVPEEMRDIWIPDDDDHVLVSADASQIEWRGAMVLSADPVGLGLLARGVDNHRAVYAESHGIPLEDVDDAKRHLAKFIVYGLGYGRGASSIAAGHDLALAAVEEFIRRFSARFNVFWNWRNGLPDIVKRQHYLANPFKRRRWWYTREITEIYNFPASSTAADMMYEEVIALEEQLPKGAELRLTVHDEVVVHAHKDIVREAITCIRTIMQQPWPMIVDASRDPATVKRFYPQGWFCPVDIHVGTNWKMTKSKSAEDKVLRAALEKSLGLSL